MESNFLYILTILSQWTETTAIRIALDMGIFQMINDIGKTDFTIDEIASYSGADPMLIGKATKSL